MKNKKRIAAFGIVGLIALGAFYLKGSQIATLDRPEFNDFDKKKLKKAYRAVFKDILTQKLDVEDKTQEELDAILIEEYHKL